LDVSITKMTYNLSSPNGIVGPCDLRDLNGWFARELGQINGPPEKVILQYVAANLDAFVQWPKEALLLWPGCNRVPDPGKKQKYHPPYPTRIRQLAQTAHVVLDRRPNGPAIASYRLAGGERPKRIGSSNEWSIHHLYSGKFPYCGQQGTPLHAAKNGNHFTQSAGLVAAHPIADARVDEFPCFAWLLRAKAYIMFGYDPDRAFSADVDQYGFLPGRPCTIVRPA
jgi:hypothetical protein